MTTLAEASRSVQQSTSARVATLAVALGMLWVAASISSHEAHQRRVDRAAAAAARATSADASGRVVEAVDLFREAVALDPRRADYRLSLAKALVAAHRPSEAEPYVQEALRQQPVNGEANLVLARIYAQTGNREEAEPAYYRAIYGRWQPSGQPLRMQARLELIDLYRRTGERNRLRAALLELSSAFPGDRELQLQAGRELLADGFHDDAVRQLRVVVERFADAGDALVLLARAELASGNYIEAYAAARRVPKATPGASEMAALGALAARVLSLDPDQRRLSSRQRLSRLRTLLIDVQERMSRCAAVSESDLGGLRPLVQQWLARPLPDAELGRTLLDATARRLPAACRPSPEFDAADRILADLARDQRND